MTSGYIAAASFAQRQLYYLDLLQPGRGGYAVPLVLEIAGPVDAGAVRSALDMVIARHDVLRASFRLADETPALAVRDTLALDAPVLEVAVADHAGWRQALADAAARTGSRPFDLAAGPLLAAAVVRPSDPAAAGCALGLVVVFHHAVADGASLPIFVDDLVAAYDAARTGEAPRWPDLPLQYPDYADWEQERFGDRGAPAYAEAQRYWRTALRDAPALLDLPLDRRRGTGPPRRPGATVQAEFSGTVGRALTGLARRRGTTSFQAFLAVFFLVLHRWSGLGDLIVTVPVSKRSRPELARLVGLFVDTLPLRVACGPETSFEVLLEAVNRAFLDGMRHRDVPFQQIVQSIGIARRPDAVPLMQILFGSLEPADGPVTAADGARFTVLDDRLEQAAKSDLSVVYRQTAERVELWCRYDPALFDAATVQRLLGWFGTAAESVAAAAHRPVADVPLIDTADGRALIARFNRTRTAYPRDRSLADLFAEIADLHGERPAIDEDGRTVSYAALADRAARLAAALAAAGVRPGDAVVLVLPLSARFAALVLAVLRLGAVYVPLDPDHPHARLTRLAAALDARAVVLDDSHDDDGYGRAAVLRPDALEAQAATLAARPIAPADPCGTAYIMFTSGSTGVPKGVAVPHRAVVRLVRDTGFAAFGPATRFALQSNPSFDASTLELWAPLLNGGTAVVVDRRSMLDADRLHRILAERAITHLWITSGLFSEIAGIDPATFAGARTVLTGGDVVKPDAARAVLAAGASSGLRLLNGYGPTENTTFSTTYDIAALDPEALSIPIGRPIANSTVYILDRGGRPLPVGVVGEIYVGGDGVAAGYVGDPERTADAFLPDPFDGRPDARMYRTGDFGRWLPDGNVVFAGRADDQVKVRGFRIELNEIAAALGRHPALRDVFVTAPRQPGGERHIVAYVVPRSPPAPAAGELRSFLEPVLPAHLLPHAYVPVDTLVLNPNGKVDRRALPAVDGRHYDRAGLTIPPRTEEERALAAIWQDVLGLDAVSVGDNFFHIGGDSILAIRMAARAAEAGFALTPRDVFQLQTIERLAESLAGLHARHGRASSDRVHSAELVPSGPYAGGTPPFVLASLVLDRRIDVVQLGFMVQRLAERHEALRLRRIRDGDANRLEVMAYVARLPIRTVEAPGLADADLDLWVAAHADRIGRGLDTRTGVTIAAALVDRGHAAMPLVVIAMHRAVADERTLALVAAEIEAMVKAGHGGAPARDAPTAYGDWLTWLEAYADAQAVGPGLAALEALPARPPGPTGLSDAPGARTAVIAERWLDRDIGTALSESVPAGLGVTSLDLLATALAASLASGPDGDAVLIEAIDGRRAPPDGAPAIAELVGNLDGVLPILAPTGPMPVVDRLRAVKTARQAVAATAPVYRVLGQTFDLPSATLGVAWSTAPGAAGPLRLHSLPTFGPSVTAMLVATAAGSRVRLAWTGAEPSEGAAAVLDRVAAELTALAALAGDGTPRLYTPADFPLAGLAPAALDRILAESGDVDDIYPLSPMQEAMLVHSLAATRSEVNFEQSCMRIRGRLDHEAFRHAWATVFERHDVLRTSFHWRGLSRPMQVVHRSVRLPLEIRAVPALDAAGLDAVLAADRERGFDLARAPLVRLTVIKVAEDDVYVVSSFHHLLIDGWCLGRLEREARAAYESFRSGRPPLFDPPVPYRSYIAWLARTGDAASRRFFATLLEGSPNRRRLFPPGKEPARGFATDRLTLDRRASRALTAFVRRRGLTPATAIHFAWAVWLGARLGTGDVVFGTTVSGRPAAVPGVERIIGLLINNLPVRLHLDREIRIDDALTALQATLAQLHDHAHLSPSAVADAAGAGGRAGGLFDTLVVVENLASGTSAWSGAPGLDVEAVRSRLQTAYDLTLVAVPGDVLVLSLVRPEDGRVLLDGNAVLAELAQILTAIADLATVRLADLPTPPVHRPAMPAAVPARRPAAGRTRPRSTLETRVADVVAGLRAPDDDGQDTPDVETDFWDLGVSSVELLQMAGRLEQSLGRPIPISMLLEHRSIAALARAIEDGQPWSAVVPMNGDGRHAQAEGGEPFVCVHPVAGDVSVFLDLARAMPADMPFWAIQAAGLEEGQEPLDSVEALAAANLRALAEHGLSRPRRLGGYSFGGLVAFEMARQLAAQGATPEQVVIIDTPAPLARTSILDPDPDRAHAQWLVRMADVRARFQGVPAVLTEDDLAGLPAADRFGVTLARLRGAGLVHPSASAAWLERAHRTSLVQYGAYLAYRPEPVPGQSLPLALIRAAAPVRSDLGHAENRQLAIVDLGWQAFTETRIPVAWVNGDHVQILAADRAAAVAAVIAGLPGPTGDAGRAGAAGTAAGNRRERG